MGVLVHRLRDCRHQLPPVTGEDAPLEALLDEPTRAPGSPVLQDQVRADQLTIRSIEGQYGPSLSATLGFRQGEPGWIGWAGMQLPAFLELNVFQAG